MHGAKIKITDRCFLWLPSVTPIKCRSRIEPRVHHRQFLPCCFYSPITNTWQYVISNHYCVNWTFFVSHFWQNTHNILCQKWLVDNYFASRLKLIMTPLVSDPTFLPKKKERSSDHHKIFVCVCVCVCVCMAAHISNFLSVDLCS